MVQHNLIDHTGVTGVTGGVTVQDEGTPLSTLGTTLNFVGAGVAATGSGATKTVTIAGAAALTSGQDLAHRGPGAHHRLDVHGHSRPDGVAGRRVYI